MLCSKVNNSIIRFKPAFNIVTFTHCKPPIDVAILNL